MSQKALVFLTGFTAVIAVAIVAYIIGNTLIKPQGTKQTTQPSPNQVNVIPSTPKATPTFTFAPTEPKSARVFSTTKPTPLPSGQTPKLTQNVRVQIVELRFVPNTVTISKGDLVTWTNKDTKAQKVVGKSWWTNELKPGESASQQFDAVGTYQYYSETTPSMTGSIIVK